VRFATDAVDEGLLTKEEALRTIDARAIDTLLHPVFDPNADFECVARGVAASPGAAKGAIVFTADHAVAAAEEGRAVILVRPFTEADDVAGFHAAKGILTSEGGKASHAALVARGMGKPAVTGAAKLDIDLQAGEVRVGKTVLHEGDLIAIDGSQGIVTADDVPLVDPADDPEFEPVLDRLWTVLEWADGVRRLGIRTNADTPADAKRAREFGAEGIGLCRTEHMFMAADRQPKMRAMIMAESLEDRRAALGELLPFQQEDFEGLFEEMRGLPVTIRLLDPPLHEFLPDLTDLSVRVAVAEAEGHPDEASLRLLAAVRRMHEENPMLGLRGVRLGLVQPGLFAMQVRAIVEAACERKKAGGDPRPEIMIPLVGAVQELEAIREESERVIASVREEHGVEIRPLIGTMIEVPRAALTAAEIAHSAEFFSFGTNDLTQMTWGFSRDDVESAFFHAYLDKGIFGVSPFESLDRPGVGRLVEIAVESGRSARPELKLGICGEHGGDPDSVHFFHQTGLDYVSCSPFRVPVARLEAGRAALGADRAGS
jgi:pyruvate,orthophosphate dikinase